MPKINPVVSTIAVIVAIPIVYAAEYMLSTQHEISNLETRVERLEHPKSLTVVNADGSQSVSIYPNMITVFNETGKSKVNILAGEHGSIDVYGKEPNDHTSIMGGIVLTQMTVSTGNFKRSNPVP